MFALHALLLIAWAVCCAAQDWRQRRISNLLTIGGALLALIYLCWNTYSWLGSPWPLTLGGIFLALLLSLPGYALNRFAAGDVKLMLALALASDLSVVLMTFIGAGCSLAAAHLWRTKIHKNAVNIGKKDIKTTESREKVAYAPAVLIGLIGALLINLQ